MKRLILVAAAVMAIGVSGLRAQGCDALVLPFFNGDAVRMAEYPAEKLEWRCQYARNAFYWSDTVPDGAVQKSITEVVNRQSGSRMTADVQINLNTLSYYAYNFNDMQLNYPKTNVTICFSTPGSAHPYLVLRSIDETYRRTEYPELYESK